MPMKGRNAHKRRLQKLASNEGMLRLSQALFAGAEAIAVEAQLSITNGAVSGKQHVPSKPGEPPNQDTGNLANNIEATQPRPLVAEVSSNSDHAMIEWDWGNVQARPYMRPARDKMKPHVIELVEKALNKLVRSSRSAGKD